MKTRMMVAVVALLVVAVAVAGWLALRQSPLPEGLIQANGRIEGDHYTVSSKVAGQIAKLNSREGDTVTAQQVLARLDCEQVRARVAQAEAAVASQAARLEAAHTGLAVLKQQVPLEVDTARAGIAHAEAALSAASASAKQSGRDAQRFQDLLKNHSIDQESAEQKTLAHDVAQARVATAVAALTQARKRLAEIELGWQQVKTREQEIGGIAAQLKQAKAALAETQSVLDDLTIRAPADGTITTRIVNEGEVVAAGSPLFDIVDLDRLYLKVYVPEKAIGKVRLGLPAQIYTDVFPDKPYSATVRYIASQAEFTPKEVQTPDERVKLVYAVKLYLDDNPQHQLTPGLPADAVIRWQEEAPWAKPRW
ncbi:MAG: secretion protein HlyD [Gammaproteobacteria bacterium]|nr:MAG: secretion protein HlyD [Gammaproteobacteria bacterium]RLA13757.1 MAG: secretion protein HlyD [Gammaproteobacteria bacterium]RLA16708.1 MAG: secretion protein HlyD [Gammaproteobacteria bacterium]